jgi:hypothetical protein
MCTLVGRCNSVILSRMAGECSASRRLRTPRAGMGARSIRARGARVRMGLMPFEPQAEHGDAAPPSPPSRSPPARDERAGGVAAIATPSRLPTKSICSISPDCLAGTGGGGTLAGWVFTRQLPN